MRVSCTIDVWKGIDMAHRYTEEELNELGQKAVIALFLSMQDQMERMNENMEALIEQIRISNQRQFGRKTEQLDQITGQISLFNEVELFADADVPEADQEDMLPPKNRSHKRKGKKEEDLQGFPEEHISHPVTDEEADAFFGEGCWRRMKSDEFTKLRYTPASWTVERHSVDVVVGRTGDHQDEFLRGKRPTEMIPKSIATPSLEAAIINGKYVNANPLDRIERHFNQFGLNLSKQTMSNWTIRCAEDYFTPLYDRLREILLSYHVTQADETPVEVIHDDRPAGSKSYMWVHRSGEFYKDRQIVLFEYQKTRHHEHPENYYRDYKGVLVTDGLQQYHLIEKNLKGVTSANCWAHARRDFADAIKAIGKKNQKSLKQSVAYEALDRIAEIYHTEGELKELLAKERLIRRKAEIKPLVDDFFEWAKQCIADGLITKGKTLDGLKYCINQEKYLRVFLEDGEVPIDNSAAERSIRPFTIGRKNWEFMNTIKGAKASAVIYSIVETARLNNLSSYYYVDHLLTELPKLRDENGNIDTASLDHLLPWSETLPENCRKLRRK